LVIVTYPPQGTNPQLERVLSCRDRRRRPRRVDVEHGRSGGPELAAQAIPRARSEGGKILLMVDVPYGQIAQIRELVIGRHPEAVPGGQETGFPAFP
jgi:hypothetical protein